MRPYGYAGRILQIDLSSGKKDAISTLDYTEKFVGGRGIAAKIYWDEVGPEVGAFDEQNTLIFSTGPMAGLPAVGGSRWEVCGKSPLLTREHFSYSNLGGTWGAELKFAGYDAMVIRGKSEKPVYLFLHDDGLEIKDASSLWGKGAIETRQILKSELGNAARVVTIGPAGENMAVNATLLADNDASGGGGLGASMGAKKLKAVVVKGARKKIEVAHPERFRDLVKYFRKLKRTKKYPEIIAGHPIQGKGDQWKDTPCYGCIGCFRKTYRATNGQEGKHFCHGAGFYVFQALKYYGERNEVPFFANRLLNEYGLDSLAIGAIMIWLESCHKAGIVTDESIGIPVSKSGSLEYIETLARKIAMREGFGELLAQGLFKAVEWVGPDGAAQLADLVCKTGDCVSMDTPRLYPITAMIHAMEPRWPMAMIHTAYSPFMFWHDTVMEVDPRTRFTAENVFIEDLRTLAGRFFGSEIAADSTTFEGKALGAKLVQDRHSALACLILCERHWPILDARDSEGLLGEPTLESKLLSAVTGRDIDDDRLLRIGERVFNLIRAALVREGHRGRDFDSLPEYNYTIPLSFDWKNPDCVVPGKEGEKTNKTGSVVDREGFEKMKDEYYQLRGWDVATGLQTQDTLRELKLEGIIKNLESSGFVAS